MYSPGARGTQIIHLTGNLKVGGRGGTSSRAQAERSSEGYGAVRRWQEQGPGSFYNSCRVKRQAMCEFQNYQRSEIIDDGK